MEITVKDTENMLSYIMNSLNTAFETSFFFLFHDDKPIGTGETFSSVDTTVLYIGVSDSSFFEMYQQKDALIDISELFQMSRALTHEFFHKFQERHPELIKDNFDYNTECFLEKILGEKWDNFYDDNYNTLSFEVLAEAFSSIATHEFLKSYNIPEKELFRLEKEDFLSSAIFKDKSFSDKIITLFSLKSYEDIKQEHGKKALSLENIPYKFRKGMLRDTPLENIENLLRTCKTRKEQLIILEPYLDLQKSKNPYIIEVEPESLRR